jgi:hypothetical protein
MNTIQLNLDILELEAKLRGVEEIVKRIREQTVGVDRDVEIEMPYPDDAIEIAQDNQISLNFNLDPNVNVGYTGEMDPFMPSASDVEFPDGWTITVSDEELAKLGVTMTDVKDENSEGNN